MIHILVLIVVCLSAGFVLFEKRKKDKEAIACDAEPAEWLIKDDATLKQAVERFILYINFKIRRNHIGAPWIGDGDLKSRLCDESFFRQLANLSTFNGGLGELDSKKIKTSLNALIIGIHKVWQLESFSSPILSTIKKLKKELLAKEQKASSIRSRMSRSKKALTIEKQKAELKLLKGQSNELRSTLEELEARSKVYLEYANKLRTDMLNVIIGLEEVVLCDLSEFKVEASIMDAQLESLEVFSSQLNQDITYSPDELREFFSLSKQ